MRLIDNPKLSVHELENLYEIARAYLLRIPYCFVGNNKQVADTSRMVDEITTEAIESLGSDNHECN